MVGQPWPRCTSFIIIAQACNAANTSGIIITQACNAANTVDMLLQAGKTLTCNDPLCMCADLDGEPAVLGFTVAGVIAFTKQLGDPEFSHTMHCMICSVTQRCFDAF